MRLNTLLQQSCDTHGFELAVLTDTDGFALAYAHTTPHTMESIAATSAWAWQLVKRMQQHVGLAEVEEFTFRTQAGQKLICHLFGTRLQPMVLVLLLPPATVPYRRATQRLVQQLKQGLA